MLGWWGAHKVEGDIPWDRESGDLSDPVVTGFARKCDLDFWFFVL